MGIQDQKWVKLTCKKCDKSEVQLILDKGSMWGGPWWKHCEPFEGFKVQCEGGGKVETEVVSATCKCGKPATVEESYTEPE